MQRLTRQEVYLVAAKAIVDPRSVEKYLNGGGLRGSVGLRIERALRECGYDPVAVRQSKKTTGISGQTPAEDAPEDGGRTTDRTDPSEEPVS